MTLSEAWTAFKASMYAFWICREPEPFNYIRDVNEMTDGTHFKFPYYNKDTSVKPTNSPAEAELP